MKGKRTMAMESGSMSPADVAAVVRPNMGYGYGGGMPIAYPYPVMGGYGNGNGCNGWGGDFIWVILLLALFGGWGGGFGGGGFGGVGLADGGLLGYAIGNNATKGDLSGLQTSNKIDSISTQLCNGFADVQSSMCNGFNTVNTGLLSGFGNANLAAAQNTASIVSAIDNSRFASQQCCCDIKSEIAESRYANQQCCCDIKTAIANSDNLNFRNTCEIENMIQAQTTAMKEEGEKTRSLIIANKIEELQRDLAQKDIALQTARFDASQIAQTANIVSQLQPVARPAYLTCSPYQSQALAYSNFGLGFGCNSCNGQFV